MSFLKKLFGLDKPKVNMKELIANGAKIIDVRTPDEFAGGHINGSVNIPLNTLPNKIDKLDKNTPLILCCASGMRSSSACGLLKKNGFTQVYNAGSWANLR
jgi:phage shock protein E